MLVFIAVYILSIESTINLSIETLIVNLAENTFVLTVMLLPRVILWTFSLGVKL